MEPTKFLLAEKEIPSAWYAIQADLPERIKPVLHPGTGKPIGPSDLAPLFPMSLIEQVRGGGSRGSRGGSTGLPLGGCR